MKGLELEIARQHPDFDAGDKFLDRELSLRGLSEGNFTDILIYAARAYYGWRVIHIRPARKADGTWRTPVSGDGEGFVDLFMLRASTGHAVAPELKVGKNKTTDAQDAWLDDFEACGVPSFVWYPKDLEEIKRVMRNGS